METEQNETAMVPASPEDMAALVAGNKHQETALDSLAAAGDYTGRVQLFGGNTKMAQSGKIPIGHYGYVNGDVFIPLGKDVDVLVIAWRPMALDMRSEVPVKFFNEKSPEFLKIQELSFQPDSGCSYGVDALIYIPKIKKFATLFFGSKSARNEIKNFLTNLGKGANLDSEFIEKKKYSWHVIVSKACTVPLEMPPMALIKKEKEKFDNEVTAKAPEKADTNERAR